MGSESTGDLHHVGIMINLQGEPDLAAAGSNVDSGGGITSASGGSAAVDANPMHRAMEVSVAGDSDNKEGKEDPVLVPRLCEIQMQSQEELHTWPPPKKRCVRSLV
jgi:hypothetical protein